MAYTLSQVRVAEPEQWKAMWAVTEKQRRAAGARATLRQPDPADPSLFVVVVDADDPAIAHAYGPFGSHNPARLLETLADEDDRGRSLALLAV